MRYLCTNLRVSVEEVVGLVLELVKVFVVGLELVLEKLLVLELVRVLLARLEVD